ncbi:parathyroid hormone/parathyroid hormone-related peptide receptor-like [Haliotis rubra]|uniref:parathyroid hormone/parathyroid hormone-related peptide receptor-like n=1 Tax=Haliotis rubra TaxID=36100 RepID=UPI001EE5605D|nr:parathyroid hormone/parathyroid hormone-related peptide receptor-like [Haliotis rubra]
MDGSMVCWIYLLWSIGGYAVRTQQITLLERFKQEQVLKKAFLQCQQRHNSTLETLTGLYCNRTWDNITCWDDSPAGEIVQQPCPAYINGFDQGEFATKECLPDGTWFGFNGSSRPWTNYSTCSKGTLQPLHHLITEHMPRVKLMYTIGYSVSLTFLILAVAIMVYFKRLHCPRNMIHLNLFLAVLVRAGISLMRSVLLVNDVGFPGDVAVMPSGQIIFLDGPHWECRLFFTLFNYAIMTNLFWIFNEGLYLQLILSISVFAEKTKLRWFVLLGWGMPILFVIPWAMVRLYLDNTMCWNVHHGHPKLYWIIKGPMAVSVVINFIFFINIVRLLFTKLSASNCHESRTFRYRCICIYCNRTWDNITCWDDSPAGEIVQQPCPAYINGFDQGEFATKECLPDGTWFGFNGSGRPWTNYSTCSKGTLQPLHHLITEHMPRVKLMYTIGYSVSLTFLILAVAIMVYFKRLHCPRNMIHLNLFLAVLVRAGISLMRSVLLVNDVGFPGDVAVMPSGQIIFLDGPHWECRLFFTLFNYAIMTNLFWIFNEGLYLQLILSISVFAEKTKLRWCWNVHHGHPKLYWIIKGPMAVSVVTVHIVSRRLAKSIVILIPLFAVYYMGFIWLPEDLGTTGIIVKLYIELGFNSFQGFFVAMLFCFLNAEVQNEIKKKWQRQVLRRASSIAGRSAASVNHKSARFHDHSVIRTTADSTAEHSMIHEQNGHLTPISEEKVPLRKSADCNDNKTGSTLQNGDSHAQCEPMMGEDSFV